jgi:Tfp pilus assembly protein PilO
MIRVNLLPHRAEKRKARQLQFIVLSVISMVLGGVIVGFVHVAISTQISYQERRNTFLKQEITLLDKQIEEIKKLREQTQALLARKTVVENLQSTRSDVVHLLDQMLRILPDGVYLKSLKQSGYKISIVGYAQSSARVSTLMRSIEDSPWLDSPILIEVHATSVAGTRLSEFSLNFNLTKQEIPVAAPAKSGGKGLGTNMNFIEELKNVDPKTPGSWPWLIKITAFLTLFLAIVAAGAVFDWQGEWDSLQAVRQEEDKLRESFLSKKREAINLDIIKKQLIDTQQSFGALLKQLPSKSEMDALLTDINQAGLGRGLQFELFRPGAEAATGVFTEQPITIKVTGNYDDLGKFASDISQLPRIVTLNDINVTPGTNNVLNMDATAKTFRYLDEEELAAQKRSAKAAGAKR